MQVIYPCQLKEKDKDNDNVNDKDKVKDDVKDNDNQKDKDKDDVKDKEESDKLSPLSTGDIYPCQPFYLNNYYRHSSSQLQKVHFPAA